MPISHSNDFPARSYGSADNFFEDYINRLAAAARSVNSQSIVAAASILNDTFAKGGVLYVCGNGGSAAIADHACCDILRTARRDSRLNSRIFSLNGSSALTTAIANDAAYEQVFVEQLSMLSRPGDALLAISSSGNSLNIVRALDWARAHSVRTIAFTGFTGGRAAQIAEVNVHVDAHNYGIVEDVHQSLMHALAQFLRQQSMPAELIPERAF